ncbi:bifunctional 5,10-methylenetetrahydrofolate dehydrogenase/5,10-methenyltetrahydrofolate cyclohydrolase [Candidatus Gracilibacteria bacterium]|nr:bifunctional 5,10-methylenetetrahydrofolate dehydrogenase/5,10-methenyltetrahydrofolate cyclohydrolase [Candidatus Gracilibacteria bacterium]
MLINGKQIAKNLYNETKKHIEDLNSPVQLDIILVGDNSSSLRYIKQKKKWAEYVGIAFQLHHFPENTSENTILEKIEELNLNPKVTGFLVQLPLPKHIDEQKIIDAIDPRKDVDGFHSINQGKLMINDKTGLLPCTPAGIMEIFRAENIDLSGKVACVIGRSNIVGKPITNLLINHGATVTCCNSKTKNLEKYTLGADIIVIATGKPQMLTEDMVQKNTVVIDVGFTVVDGKIYGDADSEALEKKGITITPVPGGVGPLTVAMIMKNILKIKKFPKI